jgi:hypothetical protein
MKTINNLIHRSSILLALSLLSACTTPSKLTPSNDLVIFSTHPLPSWHITVADFEAQQILTGTSAVVPKPEKPRVPESKVSVSVSGKNAADDALSLQWKDAWYANLRMEGGTPLDLRPYIPQGVLAFDLKVSELAQGGR